MINKNIIILILCFCCNIYAINVHKNILKHEKHILNTTNGYSDKSLRVTFVYNKNESGNSGELYTFTTQTKPGASETQNPDLFAVPSLGVRRLDVKVDFMLPNGQVDSFCNKEKVYLLPDDAPYYTSELTIAVSTIPANNPRATCDFLKFEVTLAKPAVHHATIKIENPRTNRSLDADVLYKPLGGSEYMLINNRRITVEPGGTVDMVLGDLKLGKYGIVSGIMVRYYIEGCGLRSAYFDVGHPPHVFRRSKLNFKLINGDCIDDNDRSVDLYIY